MIPFMLEATEYGLSSSGAIPRQFTPTTKPLELNTGLPLALPSTKIDDLNDGPGIFQNPS